MQNNNNNNKKKEIEIMWDTLQHQRRIRNLISKIITQEHIIMNAPLPTFLSQSVRY